jgi:hypothetical protein
MEGEMKRWVKVTLFTGLAVVAVSAMATFLVRDQIRRQRRNLFHPRALRRVAALEHISRQQASVDHLNLLRDYIAWEPRKLLRNRARVILERMEREVAAANGVGLALIS